MNMIMVLWCRFQQCLGTFTMLLVEGSSEIGLFKHYLTTFSESVISEIQKLWGSSFFSKCSKSNFDFKNAAKNFEIFFCFLDNWIWIGTVKLFLWRTRYFSSAANVLTSSPKIWHVNKRDCFQLNFLPSDHWIRYSWCDPDLNCAWARLPCCLSKGLLKQDFLDGYLTTFSESIRNFENTKSMWENFFFKISKFNLDFKNSAKNFEKLFCFSDNCIWIGNVKLFLLTTGHYSSVANMLTSSPKIWDVNKGDFLQLNWLGSDRLIW